MDYAIRGRRAIVCGSSQGLGYACALALAQEGVEIVLNGRTAPKLAQAADALREATGVPVTPVCVDITTEQGRTALLAACPEPDILINNNAGPPPGQLEDWTQDVWLQALQSNMLAAIALIQQVVRGMQARRFGRIVNITSAMVKSPRPHMALSTTARAGLTAYCKALSLEVARDNVTINNLLPERIDTPRQQQMTRRLMTSEGLDWDAARQKIAHSIAAQRFGRPEEFAAACTFFCSTQASFISGQNLQVDGGSYPGLV